VNHVLDVRGVEKTFLGCHALRGVDMTIPEGQIVGLLGPNASGKTTLLKVISGLLQPTAGSITYYGGAESGPEARRSISFCPDKHSFPRWMRVRDAFTFFRDMYSDYSQERADKLIRTLGLQDIQDSPAHRLSKGMQERLALGLTYSRVTRLYLLDEPLDGIDPVGKTQVIDTILAMQPEGSSTLISTHLVKDTERILTSVYFLSRGVIVFSGICDAIREERGHTVEQAYLEVFLSEGSI